MKRILPYFVGMLIGLLVAAVIAIDIALAAPPTGTDCFPDTNGHWAENFICWLADNGISSGFPDGTYKPENNVTRAEMAVMMQKLAQIPPESGNITIDVGPEAWRPSGGSGGHSIEYNPGSASLKTGVAGLYQFQAGVSAPAVMYDRVLYLTGATLCYSASPNAEITQVWLRAFANKNGVGGVYRSVTDATPLQDIGCKTYSISNPLNMIPTDHVNFQLEVNFTDGNSVVNVSSVTFIFSPSVTASGLAPSPLRSPQSP